MPQQDHFKRQTDQLAKLLEKLLSDLSGLKQSLKSEELFEILKTELDLDLEPIVNKEEAAFIEGLRNMNFSNESLEKLADLFLITAKDEGQDLTAKKLFYEKSISIYGYLEKTDTTFSYSRHMKLEKLRKQLG